MNDIRDKDVAGKRVLVRGDLNVPLGENGNMQDDFRIKQITPTLHFLLENKAKVILCSHFTDEKISWRTRFLIFPPAAEPFWRSSPGTGFPAWRRWDITPNTYRLHWTQKGYIQQSNY